LKEGSENSKNKEKKIKEISNKLEELGKKKVQLKE
jgi:hypothetical protein